MNLKLIGRVLLGIAGVVLLVGGGIDLGVSRYVVAAPFIAVGLGLLFLGRRKA